MVESLPVIFTEYSKTVNTKEFVKSNQQHKLWVIKKVQKLNHFNGFMVHSLKYFLE